MFSVLDFFQKIETGNLLDVLLNILELKNLLIPANKHFKILRKIYYEK